MSSESSRASLLGLPRELRDTIYVYVLQTDVDFQSSNTYWPKRVFKHSDCFCYRNDAERLAPSVKRNQLRAPWLSLMLASRQMAAEVSETMNGNGRLQDEIRTYVADIETEDFYDTGAVIWKRIPCRPDQARRLVVNIFTDHLGIAGEYGYSLVASVLYHALNTFLHCGPTLNHRRLLQNPVRLDELSLYMQCDYKEPHGYFMAAKTLARSGPLGGLVDIITVQHHKKDQRRKKFIVERGDGDGMVPDNWEAYGYGWGFKPDHIDGLAAGSIPGEILYDWRGRWGTSHDE